MRVITILAASALLTGCATQNRISDARLADVHTSPESCVALLGNKQNAGQQELDSSDIQVVNWNIQKGGDADWADDLLTFTSDPDLLIFQEAVQNADEWEVVAAGHYRSFAPGYRTGGADGEVTGVMTLSEVQPLMGCSLVSVEPWLRSPKATMITEYGLTDTDETLLVVNIHAINFTISNKAFREQVRRALVVVGEHSGPVLLSGDFNTWHWRQWGILGDMAREHGLVTLRFDEDHRTRIFGQPLDHIYVRGLRVIDATSAHSDASDHNPMSATLGL